ncbi:MAG TPA: hypothetical protein VKF59_22405 [Candidatus Dormibacteraeota bacterium]|nr:hypothetical protein [Candidatus Dormibacteraeota bacterium]
MGLLVLVVAGLSACSGPLPATHASPAPRGSAPPSAAADPQRCARLARRGFTPCPPTADRLQLPPTTIRNATNGAVTDATAQEWGRAFQLAQAYYYWAMQHNARGALTSGVLADASPNAVGNLFGTDLQDLDNARQQQGTLLFQPLQVRLIQLVAIPPNLAQAMSKQGLTASTYAFAVLFVGPGQRAIQLSDGRRIVLVSSDSTYSAMLLIWGDLRSDPDLGQIWFEHGNYGCEAAVQNVCLL